MVTSASTNSLRALAARLAGPALVVLPVRHHSPAASLQLQRLFAQAPPSAVLVEGPRSFTPLVPLLTHADARMPLAVYTYAVLEAEGREPTRHAAYYPFCDHSPELVALRLAQAAGIPAQFIDLDFAEQSQFQPGQAEAQSPAGESLLSERHFERSRRLQALARQLGCRDHEALWEHLFERDAATRPLAQYLDEMTAYCQLARDDHPLAELEADGTLQREAEMAWHLREALSRRAPGDGPVLAVLGGFHAVAMPGLLDAPPPRPRRAGRAVRDQASALIRYSFDRLDRLNGYASGMTAPAWHQALWTALERRARIGRVDDAQVRRDVTLTLLSDIAAELRERHGLPLPLPTLAAAHEQALRLAALRGRAAPQRDDVLDAVTSCFIQGDADADGALVRSVARRHFSGDAIGRVPPGASTPPLVRDCEARLRRQRLKIDTGTPQRLVLELYRRPEHRVTSRLLHGLALLEVPFGSRRAGPDFVRGTGLDRLQEHWETEWSAATEAALVEASVHGVTLPLAVAQRFGQELARLESGVQPRDARSAAGRLAQACVLGLHEQVPGVAAVLHRALGEDANFASVTAAAGSLGLLWESREPLEARDLPELPPLLQAAYERAIYLGRGLRGDGPERDAVVGALARLRELLASEAGRHLDGSLYDALIDTLRGSHDSALIRGAATGLAHAAGRLDSAQLRAALQGHLGGLLAVQQAVAFLRGLLDTARELAWQEPALLVVVDELLAQWPEPDFIASLPELRLAFAGMTPRETDRIAHAVAQRHGREGLGPLVRHDLSANQLQANLALSQTLAEVLAGDGLAAWLS